MRVYVTSNQTVDRRACTGDDIEDDGDDDDDYDVAPSII